MSAEDVASFKISTTCASGTFEETNHPLFLWSFADV